MSTFKNVFKFAAVVTPILFIISTPITTSANTHFIKTNCLLQKSQLHPGKIINSQKPLNKIEKEFLGLKEKIIQGEKNKQKEQSFIIIKECLKSDRFIADFRKILKNLLGLDDSISFSEFLSSYVDKNKVDDIGRLYVELNKRYVLYPDLNQQQQKELVRLLDEILLALNKADLEYYCHEFLTKITSEYQHSLQRHLFIYDALIDVIKRLKVDNSDKWIEEIGKAKESKVFISDMANVRALLAEINDIYIGKVKPGQNLSYVADCYRGPSPSGPLCYEEEDITNLLGLVSYRFKKEYYQKLSAADKKEISEQVEIIVNKYDGRKWKNRAKKRYFYYHLSSILGIIDSSTSSRKSYAEEKVIKISLDFLDWDLRLVQQHLNDDKDADKNNKWWNKLKEFLTREGKWLKLEYITSEHLDSETMSLFNNVRLLLNYDLKTPPFMYDSLKEIAEELEMPEATIKVIVRDKNNKKCEQSFKNIVQKKIYRAYLIAQNLDRKKTIDWEKVNSLIYEATQEIKQQKQNKKLLDVEANKNILSWFQDIFECLNKDPNANKKVYKSMYEFIDIKDIVKAVDGLSGGKGPKEQAHYRRQLADGTLMQGAGYEMIPKDDGVESFDHLKEELLTNAGFTENDSGFFVFPLEQGGLEASIGNTYNKIVYTYKDGNKTDRLTIEEHDFGNITLRLSQMIDMEIGSNVIMSRGNIKNIKIIEKAKCALISVTDDFFTGDKYITPEELEQKILIRTTENGFSYVVVGENVFNDPKVINESYKGNIKNKLNEIVPNSPIKEIVVNCL